MVALRLFTLLLLAASIALPLTARADVFPYEAVGTAGNNNVSDSNASQCDTDEGCYTRTGAQCLSNPGQPCDLQIVPEGRCTSGNLLLGDASCVFPHQAGRCASNTKVGCLSDAYVASGTLGDGASTMCSALATNVCDMDTDKYNQPFNANCDCQGTVENGPSWEVTVCGGTSPVCSDGDPDRDVGGFGVALGVELNLPPVLGGLSFAGMGPITAGGQQVSTTPYYGLENPNIVIEAQRAPGAIQRTNNGTILPVRTTDARDVAPFGTIGAMKKIRAYGNSYWGDWTFISGVTSGSNVNSHIITFSCHPHLGYAVDHAISVNLAQVGTFPDGVTPDTRDVYAPFGADSRWCHSLGRDSLAFTWSANLSPAEQTGNPCPPACKKDFDLTGTELEAFIEAGAQDADAGVQLALQSGEGRYAGAGDAMGVAAVTSMTWLQTGDMRCKVQGWDNAPGVVGRCSDSVTPCNTSLSDPNTFANAACRLDETCRSCMGPVDTTNANLLNGRPNAEGRPPGYDPHLLPELDLKAEHRIGGISGYTAGVQVPLFVVGTTGYAGSLFNDIALQQSAGADLSDMGDVLPVGGGSASFGSGIGTGGTFGNPSNLAIGETCCAAGTGPGGTIVWSAARNGTFADTGAFPWGGGLRTYDVGPGDNGIPGCMGDNAASPTNGSAACNQRLGGSVIGTSDDGFYATGQDDEPTFYDIGGNVIPASANRYSVRNASPAVVAHFQKVTNPPTVNTVAAFMVRDLNVLGTKNADVAVKVNTTQCPIVGSTAVCSTQQYVDCTLYGGDNDGDGICANAGGPTPADNCPTIANSGQADGDTDLVGDACDNCTAASNPRTPAAFLAANTWWTLTGGQRDDDNDGYGNRCDGDFPGTTSGPLINVGPADLAQFRASNGESRTGITCGTNNLRHCAIYDLDENTTTANNIGPADLARFRAVQGSPQGPRCATCPLTCTEGAASGACP